MCPFPGMMFSFVQVPMRATFNSAMAGLACLAFQGLQAQTLIGQFNGDAANGLMLLLLQARGEHMRPVDSTRVAADGTFRFARHFSETGFYQLALHDTDRVNIVLDAREPLVDLRFAAEPLAQHIQVEASAENKRMQEMTYVMDEAESIQEAVRKGKANLKPDDTLHLEALDRVLEKALATRASYLQGLADEAGKSFFAKVLSVDRAVDAARDKGPRAVAAAFNFSDPELLRSTVFDKAVLAFLQSMRPVSEDQFANASDTLMALASGNVDCRSYMLEHLIDLFATYGPERALQHLVDRYVADPKEKVVISPELRTLLDGMLALSVGHTAPDVPLNDNGVDLHLADLVRAHRFTALFFYSSTCEHCHAQVPGLIADRAKYLAKGFDVVGIALDADSAEFLQNIRENAIPWKCFSEFNGWGSQAAKAFLVKGTPAFFLLDEHMKIVAKPENAIELGTVLGKMLR